MQGKFGCFCAKTFFEEYKDVCVHDETAWYAESSPFFAVERCENFRDKPSEDDICLESNSSGRFRCREKICAQDALIDNITTLGKPCFCKCCDGVSFAQSIRKSLTI